MAHELEKKMYEQDVRWMKEPWTAWEWHNGYMWRPNTEEPIWDDCIAYRRRPGAPTKCCRLCKHNLHHKCFLVCPSKYTHGYDRDQQQPPAWCPLDAEAKPKTVQDCRNEYWNEVNERQSTKDVVDEYFDNVTPEQLAKDLKEVGCAVSKCSTCRHSFDPKPVENKMDLESIGTRLISLWKRIQKSAEPETMSAMDDVLLDLNSLWAPKPRTIRIDAELPEPIRTFWVRYKEKVVLTIETDTDADAEAIVAWFKDQVMASGSDEMK